MAQKRIRNIELTKRKSSSQRCDVDITFQVQQKANLIGYKVWRMPDVGKEESMYFEVQKLKRSDLITTECPQKDMRYDFIVYAMYGAEDAVPSETDHVVEPAWKIEIKSSGSDLDPEEVDVTWKLGSDNPRQYKIEGVHVRAVPEEGGHIFDKTVDPPNESCRMALEIGKCYDIYVTLKYKDVETDCRSESTTKQRWGKEQHFTAGPKDLSVEQTLNVMTSGKIKKGKDYVFNGEIVRNNKTDQGQKVAVKILSPAETAEGALLKFGDANDKKTVLKRMIQEARNLLELIHHENIVQYVGSVNDEDCRMMLLMELCHSETLQDRISHREQHPELNDKTYCKAVIRHITQGIHYIHSRKIYHRDLKPSNILFSRDENLVKVGDFGYSKKVNPTTGAPSSTKRTATDGFRPPETYKDQTQKNVDDRSDVFSLGLVYFMLLSKEGKHPFDGEEKHPFDGSCIDERSVNIQKMNCSFLQERKALYGLTGPDAALARDLIRSMLNYHKEYRPTTTEIFKHPYFWNEEKISEFYTKVAEWLMKQPEYADRSTVDFEAEVSRLSYTRDDVSRECAPTPSTTREPSRKRCVVFSKSGNLDFPHQGEYITKQYEDKFNSNLEDARRKKRTGPKRLVESLRHLISLYKEFKNTNQYAESPALTRKCQDSTAQSTVDSEQCCCEDNSELTELQFRRRIRTSPDWRELENRLNGVDETCDDSAKIRQIIDDAENLIADEKEGSEGTWKECFLQNYQIHRDTCIDCVYVDLFENVPTIYEDDIFDLVRYVRYMLEVKKSLDKDRSKYVLNFVAASVPELLPHLFKVMKKELNGYIGQNKPVDYSHRLPPVNSLQIRQSKVGHPAGDDDVRNISVHQPENDEEVEEGSTEDLKYETPKSFSEVGNVSMKEAVGIPDKAISGCDVESLKIYGDPLRGSEPLGHSRSELQGKFSKPTYQEEKLRTVPEAVGNMAGHSSNNVIPSVTIVVKVGEREETIEVGGCFVHFEARSFLEPQEVTATAEINPQYWPADRDAITPSLFIQANNVKKATVKLHTWCCNNDEEENVEIWQQAKKGDDWTMIKTCSLGQSRYIVFTVPHFCWLLATLKRMCSSKSVIRPIVYFSTQQFVVALVKDTPLTKKSLHNRMEATVGQDMSQKILSPLECRKSDKVQMVIRCVPGEDFKFVPENKFLYLIQDIVGKVSESYRCIHLTSQLPAQPITITTQFGKNDEEPQIDGFPYNWIPAPVEPSSSTSAESGRSQDHNQPNVFHGPVTMTFGDIIHDNTIGTLSSGTIHSEEHGATRTVTSTSRRM